MKVRVFQNLAACCVESYERFKTASIDLIFSCV